MCKVYTDVDGIKSVFHFCPPVHVRKIIHYLKLVDYLHVQADKPCYNYYKRFFCRLFEVMYTIILHLELNIRTSAREFGYIASASSKCSDASEHGHRQSLTRAFASRM